MASKRFVSGLVAVGVACSSGCSAFQPKQQSVTIIASEPSAQIFLNNSPVGSSPLKINLDRDKTYAVLAKFNGRVGSGAIGKKVSGTGAADIVGGILFLVPIIGCFTPGFWELDPTTLNVAIPPEPIYGVTH